MQWDQLVKHATAVASDLGEVALIFVANQRLVYHIEAQLAQACSKLDLTACPIQVLTISSWVKQIWQRLRWQQADLPALCHPTQLTYIWAKFLQDLQAQFPSIQPFILAKEVASAWQLCHHYGVPLAKIAESDMVEAQLLQQAFAAMQTYLQAEVAISEEEALARLIAAVQCSKIPQGLLPKVAYCYGFVTLTPLEQGLMAALSAKTLSLPSLTNESHVGPVLACKDASSLWCTVAAKACQAVQAGKTVTVVIPSLHQHWNHVAWAFQQICEPQHIAYAIGSGRPLLEQPLVQMLWRYLQCRKQFDWACFETWLGSPLLAEAMGTQAARDNFLANVHFKGLVIDNLPALCEALSEYLDLQGLKDFWQSCQVQSLPKAQPLSAWWQWLLVEMQRVLKPTALTEGEVAAYQSLLALEPLWLSLSSGTCGYADFLEAFQFLGHSTLFHGPSQSAIQVLGLYEAIGLQSDCLWLCETDEQHWPPPPKPHSLLPKALQHQYQLPRLHYEQQHAFAQALWQMFCRQARAIQIAFATQGRDGPQALSPFFSSFSFQEVAQPALAAVLFAERPSNQNLKDAYAPALDVVEMATLSGGAQVLKSLANCPFQAFTQFRLRALPFLALPTYLDLRQRGNILHDIMARLPLFADFFAEGWELAEPKVHACIQAVLQAHAKRYPHLWSKTLVQLESERLLALLANWYACEQGREPFQVVAKEKTLFYNVGPLSLKLRVDRIDRLVDGSLLVIDYKTGKLEPGHWYGEVLLEPQLPTYALALQAKGIAVYYLAAGKIKLQGIHASLTSENLTAVPQQAKVPFASWEALTTWWQQELSNLAERYVAGEASVQPNSKTKPCTYCAYQRVCRIAEARKMLE